ncbi:MAG: DUF1343 domain-containing protein, partial [Firmicutes bacterium]|nr:DUF1343 domain-containing protein [Bacillota bacterium]
MAKKVLKSFYMCLLVFSLLNFNKILSIEPVKLGIDNINSYLQIFEGKKVGLLTNATGVDSFLKSTIDVLREKVNLVAIFAPEHGIRSTINEYFVNDELDEKIGLPIFSLYGKTMKPTSEMLKNVDVLVYDIQDVGARFYTYISTMKKCMEACSENNVVFVVLDRPNILSGKVQGNILEEEFISFVGISKITTRYGLTPGEIAKYFNTEDNINCNLFVIEMSNYKKDMYYDETGLNFWIKPSPAIMSLDTAIAYVGTCIFEWTATNISDGRGTGKPFEYIGAPWINSKLFAERLNTIDLAGVNFEPVSFIPCRAKFKDELCHGVFIKVLDRKIFD